LKPEFHKVAVIGAGDMGHGIAAVFALGGLEVNLTDKFTEALNRARERIRASVERLVSRGKISQQDAASALSRINYVEDIGLAVKDADLVLEAVPENPELKKSVFKSVDSIAKKNAVFASNTSNIRITELASSTGRPELFLGMHFFNPPLSMKLVELVPGERTDAEVLDSASELCRKIGKTPIRVLKDSPGFIVNRINAADVLFFSLILDKGIASPAEVDAYAKMQGLPMGPYELLDFVGLDIAYDSLRYFSEAVSSEYARFDRIKQMVESGKLGKKSGEGFYQWKDGRAVIPEAKPTEAVSMMDLFAIEINEAVKLIEEGVSTPPDIDTAVILGMNRPFGPISVAKSFTSGELKSKLEELSGKFGCQVFAPAKSISEGRLREAVEGRLAPKTNGSQIRPSVSPISDSNEKLVTLEKKQNGVAVVSINRPPLNLINGDVLDGLEEAVMELSSDQEVKVVVITGAGKNLSAGADLGQYITSSQDFVEFSRRGQRVFRRITEMPKLTICVLKGYVLGGGFELALSCDLRIASKECTMGFPEVTRGLIPGWSGTQRLAKLIGVSRATQLILTGGRIGAEEAMKIGLVHTIVESGDIDSATADYASEIASKVAPVAVSLAKRLLDKGSEVPSDIGLEMEALAMGILFGTEDLKEGISAFMQKRSPKFKGR
jgi:enoyl-CoA hydratase/3-hydroxyacyl-CoA dehydrogenase